jgi:hypothetical protein
MRAMDPASIHHVLDPACPWYPLKKVRLPHVKWCEEQLCAWVEEPANTWSNLGYILLGVLMWRMARGLKSRCLRFYGPASVVVGVSSLVYHASNNFILQVFDFFGMYVFCYLLIMINLLRLGRWTTAHPFRRFWLWTLATTAGTVALDDTGMPIQGIVLLLVFVIIGTEVACRRRAGPTYRLTYFFLSMALMGIALVFSILDHERILCDPQNHWLQGHALWHLIAAVALLASFIHHRQFDAELV